MPRKARQESSTKVYHVMVRGLNKLPVFKQTREKTRIVNLIRENLEKYDVAIYAYCIMPNHFHLLIKAELKELASYMAKILAAYANYYNYKHDRVGYVFQDRYKSQCVEEETYFWNCLRYIHANPLKSEHPRKLIDYTHSSMKEFYYEKCDIVHEEVLKMMKKRFDSVQDFLEFHKSKGRELFIDTREDMFTNSIRIALEILNEMHWKTGEPMEELLEYIATRKEFEKKLAGVLHISMRKAQDIEKAVRKELAGTG